jgi:hypothetical protein
VSGDWILIFFLVVLAVLVAGWVYVVRTVLLRFVSEQNQRFAFRLAAALTSAVLVFVVVYMSSIAAVSQMRELDGVRSFLGLQGQLIREALAEYRKRQGRYPDSLDQLPGVNERFFTEDRWHHPYQYSVSGDGYTLVCLGRDGKPGGEGLDADIDLSQEGPIHVRPTTMQLLFETQNADGVFTIALLAALFSGLTCYVASKPRQSPSVSAAQMVVSIVVTTVAAAFVSLGLVLMYFVSGH